MNHPDSTLIAETAASCASLIVMLPAAAGMYWFLVNGPLSLALVVGVAGLLAGKFMRQAVMSAWP